ncbi:hypothetical protein GL279_17745 [Paracoccus limosus]|uniref:Uncharacterized protein n=1 Tax=Paracoccus limosus TaxID=913252 RepID=A0A844H6F5_9RHOB|nr:hypothetical protein [Paracoccus limosus]MTH36436.1 hypothetical protein [Paracoccus limosus]
MAENDRTKVDGRQTLEFDLLDPETQERVIECIQKRGKISVVIEDRGVISADQLTAFKQLID